MVPKPFSRALLSGCRMINVPEDSGDVEREQYHAELQAALEGSQSLLQQTCGRRRRRVSFQQLQIELAAVGTWVFPTSRLDSRLIWTPVVRKTYAGCRSKSHFGHQQIVSSVVFCTPASNSLW